MTEPSNFITITVEGEFRCQSRPTSTGLAADVGLLDDAEPELVADGEPQPPASSRKAKAEANRNVNMTLSPGKLCRSSRSFELADYQFERGAAGTVTVAASSQVGRVRPDARLAAELRRLPRLFVGELLLRFEWLLVDQRGRVRYRL